MSRKTELEAASAPASKMSCEPDRKALCGSHIGDRRVRIERQPRSVTQKVASAVRRVLSR